MDTLPAFNHPDIVPLYLWGLLSMRTIVLLLQHLHRTNRNIWGESFNFHDFTAANTLKADNCRHSYHLFGRVKTYSSRLSPT